jgi:hypothetical protein
MKVLVQNPLTLSYLQKPEGWTRNPEQATAFPDTRSAVQFCREHDLADMQVVLKFPDERFDVQLPVTFGAPASQRGEIQERIPELVG